MDPATDDRTRTRHGAVERKRRILDRLDRDAAARDRGHDRGQSWRPRARAGRARSCTRT